MKDNLIEEIKKLAERFHLQNWEQIDGEQTSIAALNMIAQEYKALLDSYIKRK